MGNSSIDGGERLNGLFPALRKRELYDQDALIQLIVGIKLYERHLLEVGWTLLKIPRVHSIPG